jgi:hypothetical protein
MDICYRSTFRSEDENELKISEEIVEENLYIQNIIFKFAEII